MIELVTVMVLIAIVAATAAPVMDNLSETRAAAAARMLRRDLTFARQWALATGTPCWIEFDTTGQTWSVLVEDPSNPGRADAAVLTDAATNAPRVQVLGAGDFIDVALLTADFGSTVNVGFDWLGRPLQADETAPGVFTVTALTAPGTVTITGGHTVSVEMDTGHVGLTP